MKVDSAGERIQVIIVPITPLVWKGVTQIHRRAPIRGSW